MRYVRAFFCTVAVLLTLGLPLYFYFTKTLIAIVCIMSVTFIGSIVWAFGKYKLDEIIDPIREKYKMNTVKSRDYGNHLNIDDAARKSGQDIRMAKHLLNTGSDSYYRIRLMKSLPEWIIKIAFPFLAISAPKWIIAVIIGVLVIRFHEDIIPHKNEEQKQSFPNEITLQVKISGDIQKGEDMLDSTIDINDYCMRAHSSSNVIVLSDDGCN